MKLLTRKILIFFSPLLLYVGIPYIILFASNELTYNLDKIVSGMISGKRYLFGLGFDEKPYKYLKLRMLRMLPRQDVIAIGSSRVLQFRAQMFSYSNFYNAGYTVDSIKDFVTFMSLVPDNKIPTILIVGLDQWMFNKNCYPVKGTNTNAYTQYNNLNFSSVFKSAPRIFTKIIDGNLTEYSTYQYCSQDIVAMNKNSQLHKVGFNACVNETGFRNDGSMLYGKQIRKLLAVDPTAEDFKFSDTFKRIDTGISQFKYAKDVNNDALQDLQIFLDFCKSKNIFVIAILPPFADSVYSKMTSSDKYNYLDKLNSNLLPLFLKYNYEFYNFSNFSSIGSTDAEAIDGFHGSESVYLNLIIKILNTGSKLAQYTDLNLLVKASNDKINRYTVFKNP